MRSLVLLMILTGCGRFGIDERDRPDAALVVDTTPPVCAHDGDACDDDNICTPSSTCAAGQCIGTGGSVCRVGSMGDEYSTTAQGIEGWYYGYWNVSGDSDGVYAASDFTELVPSDGVWRPADWEATGANFTWCYVASWGGHPGKDPQPKFPIWRWTSDVSGAATVHAHVRKDDTSGGGDGIRGLIFVDGVQRFAQDVAWDDLVGWQVALPVSLRVGTQIDLMIDPRDSDAVDTTGVAWTIDSRD